MRVQDEPEIQELLRKAAEDLQQMEEGKEEKQGNQRTIRSISTILARLNDIRIHRLHEQLRNKVTYQCALFILIPLSFVLLYVHKLIVNPSASSGSAGLKPDILSLNQISSFPRKERGNEEKYKPCVFRGTKLELIPVN